MEQSYLELRAQAFATSPESIGIYLENNMQVYAAVVDIPIKNNMITLFCTLSGIVSLYYSTGKVDIGLGENRAVNKAAMSFLVSSGQCLKFMTNFENLKLNKMYMHVYLFYSEGVKDKTINLKLCKKKEDKFLNFLIQNILSAIRQEQSII